MDPDEWVTLLIIRFHLSYQEIKSVVAKIFHNVFDFLALCRKVYLPVVLLLCNTPQEFVESTILGNGIGGHTIMIIDTKPKREAAYFTFDKFWQIDSDYFIKGQK